MTAYDDFAEAGTVTLSGGTFVSATVSNIGFTDDEVGQPDPFSFGYRSAWWVFTPDADITVNVDTSAMGANLSVLTIFTGATVDALTWIQNDVSGNNNPDWSLVTASLTGGVDYHIMVGSLYDGVDLDYIITVAETTPPPAALEAPCLGVQMEILPHGANNDMWEDAALVSFADGGTYTSPTVGTIGLTKQDGEDAGADDRSAWWTYTPIGTGTATVDTELSASGADTFLRVYTGSTFDTLTYVEQDDDGGVGATSRLTFTAVADTTYTIRVSSFDDIAFDDLYVLRVSGPRTYGIAIPPIDVEVAFYPGAYPMVLEGPPISLDGGLPVPTGVSVELVMLSPARPPAFDPTLVPVAQPVFRVSVAATGLTNAVVTIEFDTVDSFPSPTTLTTPVPDFSGTTVVALPAPAPLASGYTGFWRARLTSDGLDLAWLAASEFRISLSLLSFDTPVTATVITGTPLPHLWFALPGSGQAGDQTTVIGAGFGSSTGSVALAGLDAEVISWTPVAGTGATTGRVIDSINGQIDPEHVEVVIVIPDVDTPGGALEVSTA